MIENARYSAIKKVNEELINLYWNVGNYLNQKLKNAEWGDSVVKKLANFMKQNYPEIKGFNRRGLYRMKQFYETYKDDEIVSPVVTQISWTNHLIILSKTKSQEERQFYIKMGIRENYSKRELERQINSAYFEQ
jgi:predicted nuclease of restriction endonuclease-like (RecB) superfamily